MAAVNVTLTRGNTATINNTAITDGQLLYNTQTRTQYLDNGTTRLQIGQNIIVDTTLNSSSNNPIANSGVAGVMYTSLSEISTITQAGNIPDALAIKELNNNMTVITSTLSSLNTGVSINYPTGFNMTNSIVIGFQVELNPGAAWIQFYYMGSHYADVVLFETYIQIACRNSAAENKAVKILLIKR